MIGQLLSSFPDEFHRLDRALFQRDESGGSRAVQFTASRRFEGVTSIVLAFATFLARLHGPQEVIVVDANLRNPAIGRILDVSPEKSLVKVLTHSCRIEAAIQAIPESGVCVIQAGTTHDRSAVESCLENLGDVLAELRKKFRYILVDSPPVIQFIDSNIISGYTDGVVIVVESNATRSEVLDDAMERLKSGGAPILGTILNKREFHIPKWLYRYL
ncbi:MAG TPA: CpsD/CapB family tyrosine-protein kinase [Desulfomonilaceae bacterium]|nr:CpsD/CapB family tyrosine-protein kinase [Desulfomonilaceae bacterium]